jgi:hypothetical protein
MSPISRSNHSTVTPAPVELPYEKFESESHGFLLPCAMKIQEMNDACQNNHRTFTRLYIQAMGANFLSISALAWVLSPAAHQDPASMDQTLGIRTAPVEVCAWRSFLSAGADAPPDLVRAANEACDPLSSAELRAAVARVRQIGAAIEPQMRLPPGWQPAPY